MKLSWQWVVVIVVLAGLSVLAEHLGQSWLSGMFAGGSIGLLPKAGAVSFPGPKSPGPVALVLALLSAGCGSSAAYGAIAGVCEAHEAAIEAACDSTGPSTPGGDDGQCQGRLSTEEYRDALRCTRDLCGAIQARIEGEADDE